MPKFLKSAVVKIVLDIIGSALVVLGTTLLTVSLESLLDEPSSTAELLQRAWVAAIAFSVLAGSSLVFALVASIFDCKRPHAERLENLRAILLITFTPAGVALSVTASLLLTALIARLPLHQGRVTGIAYLLFALGTLMSFRFWRFVVSTIWAAIKREWPRRKSSTAKDSPEPDSTSVGVAVRADGDPDPAPSEH